MGQSRQWVLLRAAEQCYRVAAKVSPGVERDLWIRRGGMLEADGVAALMAAQDGDPREEMLSSTPATAASGL